LALSGQLRLLRSQLCLLCSVLRRQLRLHCGSLLRCGGGGRCGLCGLCRGRRCGLLLLLLRLSCDCGGGSNSLLCRSL
jgi:hypothetical protein